MRLDERWLCKLIDERGGGGGGGVRRTVVSAGGSAAAEQKQEGFRPEAKLQIEIWKSEAGEIHSIKGRVRGIESFSVILNSSSELVRRSTYNNYSLHSLTCLSVFLSLCLSAWLDQ